MKTKLNACAFESGSFGLKKPKEQLKDDRAERVERAITRVRLHAQAKKAGATHIVRTGAGRYYFASFRRSFFGLGRTVLTVYRADSWESYSLTNEAAQCVTIIGVLK